MFTSRIGLTRPFIERYENLLSVLRDDPNLIGALSDNEIAALRLYNNVAENPQLNLWLNPPT